LRFGEGESRGRSDEERQHSLWQAQALDLQDVSHCCSVAMIPRCMKERDNQMQLWMKLWSCLELYHLRRQVTLTFDDRKFSIVIKQSKKQLSDGARVILRSRISTNGCSGGRNCSQ